MGLIAGTQNRQLPVKYPASRVLQNNNGQMTHFKAKLNRANEICQLLDAKNILKPFEAQKEYLNILLV